MRLCDKTEVRRKKEWDKKNSKLYTWMEKNWRWAEESGPRGKALLCESFLRLIPLVRLRFVSFGLGELINSKFSLIFTLCNLPQACLHLGELHSGWALQPQTLCGYQSPLPALPWQALQPLIFCIYSCTSLQLQFMAPFLNPRAFFTFW